MSKNIKKLSINSIMIFVNIIVIILCFILNKYLFFCSLDLNFLYLLSLCICIINITGYFIHLLFGDKLNPKYKKSKKMMIIFIISFVVIVLLNILLSSKIFNYQKYRELAGKIETTNFESDMQTIDLKNLPIINENIAYNLADKKLGEIPSLGSQVEIGDLTLQNLDGTLYFVAPLEHKGFFKWFKQRTTMGYVKVNATKENNVELVTTLNNKPISLKYLQSSFFGTNLKRYAYSICNNKVLDDFDLELDDNGNPYWVISKLERTIGTSGLKTVGTLIIDAQTGEYNEYSLNDTPKWVDRIQPFETVKTNLKNYGTLIHGCFNFSDKDKVTLTPGGTTIYDGEDCYYYMGVTSTGQDEGIIGFYLTNTRTNKTKFYKVSGADENAARSSANGKLSNYGYSATYPILVNIQNTPTYFMKMLDEKGLVKSYSFVNVSNYNLVSVGETIDKAYNSYVETLSRSDFSSLITNNNKEVIEGTIDRIGMYISNSTTYYMIILVEGEASYIVPTDVNNEVCIAKEGDLVKMEFIDNTSSSSKTVSYFELKK